MTSSGNDEGAMEADEYREKKKKKKKNFVAELGRIEY